MRCVYISVMLTSDLSLSFVAGYCWLWGPDDECAVAYVCVWSAFLSLCRLVEFLGQGVRKIPELRFLRFLHISPNWDTISLHTEFHPPRLPGSGRFMVGKKETRTYTTR